MADEGIAVGILTVSDRCFQGEAEDRSGPNLTKLVLEAKELNVKQIEHDCVQDSIPEIKKVLCKWSDVDKLQLIITTGGTGFSPRDVTPEATSQVIHRISPGLSQHMIAESLKVTPLAVLSRPVCGMRNKTLIINLPGSVKGSQECFQFTLPVLPHALDIINGSPKATATHNAMVAKTPSSKDAPVHVCPHKAGRDLSKVAERDRHSPYPLMPMDKAISAVMEQANHLGTHLIDVQDGLDCVLAEDVCSAAPFPPFPASIKDGYAVLASDGPGVRKVVGPVTAGEITSSEVTSGHVMRITTGAPVPPGSDAVVQVEDTELVESADEGKTEVKVKILSTPKVGQDIRPIGFDISSGELVLSKGDVLGPAELGLLATVGVTQVSVFKKPKVAILSTGNEIVQPTGSPKAGQIRDSNKTTLTAAVKKEGFDVIDLGIARDNPESLEATLTKGLSEADVVISSGGVSMGEKDLLKPVLEDKLGATIHFGRVFMKPGKPTTFSTVPSHSKKKLIFALPGNPVSALVTFYLFVLPALHKMSGHPSPDLTRIKVKLANAIALDPRPEYQRVKLSWQPDDPVAVATTTGSQCSSRLLSLRTANALLELPPRSDTLTQIPEGSLVNALIIGSV
ncbi:gephyrin-like [Actinia tenebrosa]|uniref:Gephyrin-like n=1 Tax=Actinia tenebrosa TaxID=6105 RepID=A0A6P8I0P5_ACTTE|nr:gephyrin-like [Actinia tenebrosa]